MDRGPAAEALIQSLFRDIPIGSIIHNERGLRAAAQPKSFIAIMDVKQRVVLGMVESVGSVDSNLARHSV